MQKVNPNLIFDNYMTINLFDKGRSYGMIKKTRVFT